MAKKATKHLISIADLSTSEIVEVLDRAEWHRTHESRPSLFQYKTAGLIFTQPSTRTRVGFHVAMSKLGGQAVEINETKYQAGMDRAESLSDTICSISSYFDIIIMRHSSSEELERAAMLSSAPVINGGSGNDHHPTQALIDLFAIRRRFGTIDGLRIGLAGDLRGSRSARSLLCALQHFAPAELRIMTPKGQEPPQVLLKTLAPNIITLCNNLRTDGVDVLYMVGFPTGDGELSFPTQVREDFRLTPERTGKMPDSSVILCPLPRIDEIDTTVDSSPKAGYFLQSADGLYVRMAVLEGFLGGKPK